MMLAQILMYIILFVMGVVPLLFLTLSIPVVIVWKIIRRIRYGIKITD